MAVRKSQQKCVNKYIDNHYDRINLTVPKGRKETIQEVAQKNGESVNAFLNRLIDTELEHIEQGGGTFHISTDKKDNL